MALLAGLTGGIASGKSTVAAMLSGLGAYIVDADRIAHDIVLPGKPAYEEIVRVFGAQVVGPKGHLDRKRLGEIAFGDTEARKILNEITHPLVRESMYACTETLKIRPNAVVIWDVPLLFEGGLSKKVETTLVVYVDEQTQISRLMNRNGWSEEEAKRRIAAQWPIEKKRELADIVIDNRGSLADTELQVKAVWRQLSEGSANE